MIQKVKEVNIKELNDLLMTEINQYHAVVKDFSNQSISIKKLSITIYIAFLSLYFAAANMALSQLSFFIIGLSISAFCYAYEIYLDFIRQRTRRKMENKIIEYEKINNLNVRKESKIIIKFFCLKLYRDDDMKIKLGFKHFPDFGKLYVDIVHSMYSIYLIEIGVTILIGVLEF